jgi:cohesin complex subunit SA-1/2
MARCFTRFRAAHVRLLARARAPYARAHTIHTHVQREIRKDNETCIVSFFNSIFIHRYKDAHAEVRAKCTEAVGKVIMDYSSKFLDNMYLKYIGWALYDKSPEVRLVALDAVDTFYKSQLVNHLEAFTSRFR